MLASGRNLKLKEGLMLAWKKRTTTAGDWKQRFVVLFHDQIALYRHRPGVHSDDNRPNFIASFLFTNDSRVMQKTALRRYSLEFFGVRPNQPVILACTTEKEFIDWIKLIDLTLSQFKKGGAGNRDRDGMATMVLAPKQSFAVPLKYLALSDEGQSYCLCLRPTTKINGLPLRCVAARFAAHSSAQLTTTTPAGGPWSRTT